MYYAFYAVVLIFRNKQFLGELERSEDVLRAFSSYFKIKCLILSFSDHSHRYVNAFMALCLSFEKCTLFGGFRITL